ncbi:ribosomal protein S7 [Piedraia hortae CBS 480.64]|uniref:Small ribosomal subunit protein uS7m n=1 Tax=Piedraia hortae CBS 480.64 TaxID=1314780 RepID=A0A6A7C011_9PEZI|nr:ribosomal protein S7 [Piedraia hortae CBS 480.64]
MHRLAIRQRAPYRLVSRPLYRSYTQEKPAKDAAPEHVSEEAAKMSKIMGNEGPDIQGQATPVQDILKEDENAKRNAPKVLKEDLKSGHTAPPPKTGTRSFSTYSRRLLEVAVAPDLPSAHETVQSHKFPLPPLPLPPNSHLQQRYDPLVQQLTNLMMRDGKKARAQTYMATILEVLRTSPAPVYNPARPLLPGAPPASHLPLHPVLYLGLAVDSVAPLLRINHVRGVAGGGAALPVPSPLTLRQRRWRAFKWILEAAEKRQNRGSGKKLMFPHRVAQEIIAVVEGKSSVWEKRQALHKLATTARANLGRMRR